MLACCINIANKNKNSLTNRKIMTSFLITEQQDEPTWETIAMINFSMAQPILKLWAMIMIMKNSLCYNNVYKSN